MNASTMSTTFHSIRKGDFNGSFSEKSLSPVKRNASPIGKRLEEIQNKLNAGLTKSETTEYERRTKIIDEEITVHWISADEKLKTCDEQVNKLEGRVIAETDCMNILIETLAQDMNAITNDVVRDLEQEKQVHKQSKQKVLQDIESRAHRLRIEVAQEKEKVNQGMKKTYQELSTQVSNLQNGVQREIIARNESNQKLVAKLNNQISKLQETINQERKIKQKADEALHRAVEDLNKKLRVQVNVERETREKAEEQMLQLLDEACNKLEIQGGRPKKINKWLA